MICLDQLLIPHKASLIQIGKHFYKICGILTHPEFNLEMNKIMGFKKIKVQFNCLKLILELHQLLKRLIILIDLAKFIIITLQRNQRNIMKMSIRK